MQHTNTNATTATREKRTDGTANIISTSFNVAVPHALLSSNLKLALKLGPARVTLDSLPQDLQDHVACHTATMLNLFDGVNKK